MRERIDEPMAEAVIWWRTAEQGGRRSGPPTGAVYMATTVFEHVDLHLSIVIEQLEELGDDSRTCKVDFLVRELAQPHLSPGLRLPVMEGPRVVAELELTSVRARGD